MSSSYLKAILNKMLEPRLINVRNFSFGLSKSSAEVASTQHDLEYTRCSRMETARLPEEMLPHLRLPGIRRSIGVC
jgi:hypothetical protein